MPKCPRCGYEAAYRTQTYEVNRGPASIEVEEAICGGCGLVVKQNKRVLELDRDQSTLDEFEPVLIR